MGEKKLYFKRFTGRQLFLILMPVLLILTTYFAFQLFTAAFGLKTGYLAGFLFYWIIWGLVVPLIVSGFKGVRSFFGRPQWKKHRWIDILLLAVPCLLAIFFGPFLQRAPKLTWLMWIVSFAMAAVNAVTEEIIWRGLYIRHFKDPLWGCIYPLLGFALWHISPNSVNPSSFGVPLFILFSGILGVFWGIVAYRTKSTRWTLISHIIVDFSGLIGLFYLS